MFALSQVAAKALEMAVFGAYYNVTINLKDITDDAFKESVSASVALCMAVGPEAVEQVFLFMFILYTNKPETHSLYVKSDLNPTD